MVKWKAKFDLKHEVRHVTCALLQKNKTPQILAV
jgi:hypothetical protein